MPIVPATTTAVQSEGGGAGGAGLEGGRARQPFSDAAIGLDVEWATETSAPRGPSIWQTVIPYASGPNGQSECEVRIGAYREE